MCDMTHWYLRHDSFICATWLIHMRDMTRSYQLCNWSLSVERHDTHTNDCWSVYEWHDSLICATWLLHINVAVDLLLLWVTTHIQASYESSPPCNTRHATSKRRQLITLICVTSICLISHLNGSYKYLIWDIHMYHVTVAQDTRWYRVA